MGDGLEECNRVRLLAPMKIAVPSTDMCFDSLSQVFECVFQILVDPMMRSYQFERAHSSRDTGARELHELTSIHETSCGAKGQTASGGVQAQEACSPG